MPGHAGEMDISYGESGYARFPGMPPDENARVIAITQDPDGSLAVVCAVKGERKNFFIRITSNGKWDTLTGFRPIEVPADQDDSASHFEMIARNPAANTYIAQSTTYYMEEDQSIGTCAVGQYDLNFNPLSGFGKLGITLHTPGHAPTKPNTTEPVKVLRSERIGNEIRSLFISKRDTESEPTAWIALLDALTGLPLPGVGQARVALPILDVQPGTPTYPLRITDSDFLDDGSLVLAGSTDWRQIITKFKADGSLDTVFGINQVAAHRKEVKFSVDRQCKRVVTVAGTPRNFGEQSVLIVRRFFLDGRVDSDFGENGLVNIFMANYEWNTVIGVSIDSAQRVIIATNQRKGIDVSNHATVTRLLNSGHLDKSFGSLGHFQDPTLQLQNLLFNDGELKLLAQKGDDFLAIRLHL
ncbi:hypothetical protein [Pseudomonas putida]|uniref:Uncharacterized protein n=1 Tax=Pseudomonas putida TaxID=303 RepID=A0A6I6Y051_PSEPU|nr:hypothetical protein [Pseudomonas putida]QHG64884.2 hypothetical protein C2H86_10840 [Pseudomonas putida]